MTLLRMPPMAEAEPLTAATADHALMMGEEAFRAFYELTARGLWAYLSRISGDRRLADDLLQEAYYRLLRSNVAFESDDHRRNYLYRIATNLVRDDRRRPRADAASGAEMEQAPASRRRWRRRSARRAAARHHARHEPVEAARAQPVVAGLRAGLQLRGDRGRGGRQALQPEVAALSRPPPIRGDARAGRPQVTAHECPREAEVAAAVRQRAWRTEDEDVRRHVEHCAVCAEVATVCEALAEERDALRRAPGRDNPALPSAGQVWHRATLRARAEGLQSASRSLVWAYGIAGAAVAGLTAALVGAFWPTVVGTLRRMAWMAPAPPLVAGDFGGWVNATLQTGLPFVVVVGVCLAAGDGGGVSGGARRSEAVTRGSRPQAPGFRS